MPKNNSLFGEPIVSSNEDIDKDYDLDANGIDIDPNDESLNANEKEPLENTKKGVISGPVNPDEIFQEEPLEPANITYSQNPNEFGEQGEIVQEPKKKSHKGLIIFSIILIAVLATAIGGFIYGYYTDPSKKQAQPVQTKTETEKEPTENITENNTTNNSVTIETPSSSPSNQKNSTNSNTDNNTQDTNSDTTTDDSSTEETPVYDDSNADQPPMDYDTEFEDESDVKDYQQPDYQNRKPLN